MREIIQPKSVTSKMEGDFGYVRLAGFNEKATDETLAAINALRAKNPQMKGLILDLRNNPGGLLDQAVGVAGLFLNGGEVVSQRGRDPQDIERYDAKGHDVLNGMPLVVLINSGTASASEIVSGALQDRHRAAIVGVTSFGKGSVQTVIPLRGGLDGALKLTTARYFTPSGRSIQKTGIQPDLEVAETREEAQQIADEAFSFTEATLPQCAERRRGQDPRRPARAGRGAAAGLRPEERRLPADPCARRAEVRLGRGDAEAAQARRDARPDRRQPRPERPGAARCQVATPRSPDARQPAPPATFSPPHLNRGGNAAFLGLR